MPAANERKVVLVTRKTRLEDLIAKYLTAAQARFYVEHLGADFSDYQREHDVYWQQRDHAVQTLAQWGRYQIIDRSFLPNFIFGPSDIVVALGQDGLVANTMKYLDGHPLIGVNPGRRDATTASCCRSWRPISRPLLPEVAADKRPCKSVTMAKAMLDRRPGAARRQRSLHRRAHPRLRDLRDRGGRPAGNAIVERAHRRNRARLDRLVQEHRHRLARHRRRLRRRAERDRILCALPWDVGRTALRGARTVPEPDLADKPGLWTTDDIGAALRSVR